MDTNGKTYIGRLLYAHGRLTEEGERFMRRQPYERTPPAALRRDYETELGNPTLDTITRAAEPEVRELSRS